MRKATQRGKHTQILNSLITEYGISMDRNARKRFCHDPGILSNWLALGSDMRSKRQRH